MTISVDERVKSAKSKLEESIRDVQFYIKELQSEECACDGPKKRGNSFCYKCFTSLPLNMQRDLYQNIWDGYGEAYDKAVVWLETQEH